MSSKSVQSSITLKTLNKVDIFFIDDDNCEGDFHKGSLLLSEHTIERGVNALAQETPIILLDEATAHLDFVNRVKIFKILQRLAVEQNKLIFLATHELEIALKFANLVILFPNFWIHH